MPNVRKHVVYVHPYFLKKVHVDYALMPRARRPAAVDGSTFYVILLFLSLFF